MNRLRPNVLCTAGDCREEATSVGHITLQASGERLVFDVQLCGAHAWALAGGAMLVDVDGGL